MRLLVILIIFFILSIPVYKFKSQLGSAFYAAEACIFIFLIIINGLQMDFTNNKKIKNILKNDFQMQDLSGQYNKMDSESSMLRSRLKNSFVKKYFGNPENYRVGFPKLLKMNEGNYAKKFYANFYLKRINTSKK